MSKKKNQKTVSMNWRIPQPTEGDAKNKPDVFDHRQELLAAWGKKVLFKQVYSNGRKNVSDRYLEKFVNDSIDHYNYIVLTYFKNLYKLGGYLTEEERKNIDTIDLAPILTSDEYEMPDNFKEYVDSIEDEVYAITPCFPRGMLHLGHNTGVEFEVKEVNAELGTIKLFIREYRRSAEDDVFAVPGVSGEVTISAIFDENYNIRAQVEIDPDTYEDKVDIYTKISPKALGWKLEDVKFWEAVVIQDGVDQFARYLAHDDHPLAQLGKNFAYAVLISNYFLSQYRPTMEKEYRSKRETKPHARKKVLTRRVRTVGTVKFYSVKTPRQTNKDTVRHWHVASWTTRGHIRHYSDGKKVYIKPVVKYRKALKDQDNNVTIPKTIRFVDNRPKEQNDGAEVSCEA